MKQEFEKAAAQVRAHPEDYYPFVILAEGDSTVSYGMGGVMENALNPIMEAMPCPLPGVTPEKRNLRFGVETMTGTPAVTCYHFADREMFDYTEKDMTARGFTIQTLTL